MATYGGYRTYAADPPVPSGSDVASVANTTEADWPAYALVAAGSTLASSATPASSAVIGVTREAIAAGDTGDVGTCGEQRVRLLADEDLDGKTVIYPSATPGYGSTVAPAAGSDLYAGPCARITDSSDYDSEGDTTGTVLAVLTSIVPIAM